MNTKEIEKEAQKKDRYGLLILMFLLVIIIWFLSWKWVDDNLIGETARGTFGDKFGAINSLFSGLAFAGIIYALVTQKKELQLQRQTLKLQIDELHSSVTELAGQRGIMSLQRFETTFFNMISLHSTILEKLKWKGNPDINGRAFTDKLFFRTRSGVNENTNLEESFLNEVNDYFSNLRVYFMNVYNILMYIDDNPDLTDEKKKGYVHILSCQLSVPEFFIITLIDNLEEVNDRKLFKKYDFLYDLETINNYYKS